MRPTGRSARGLRAGRPLLALAAVACALAIAALAGATVPAAAEGTVSARAGPGMPAAAGSPTPTAAPSPSATPAPSASPGPSGSPSPLPWPSAPPTPTPSPAPTPRPEPLPRCTYQDIPTRDRDPGDWATTFLDTIYRLPVAYAPKDLVRTGVAGGGSVRRLVAADLRAMVRAAAAAGAPVQVVSAYRSYGTQVYDFAYWVRVSGLASALLGSARPGHSEHQLGTTVDVTSLGAGVPWYMYDWGATPAGRWMRLNAWRYGFVMSYPRKGSPARSCYRYEPWHFRYVGKERAAAVRASGLTLREYLWRNRAP